MSNQQVINTLNRLHRMCKAGERGFNAVAENVRNRGLKVLLRTYAEQRRQLAHELKNEVERLGGQVSERRSVLGIIHRGRIDIMATLTIERDKSELVALREAIVGEKSALRAYNNAMRRPSLPQQTRELLQQHHEQIQSTSEEVSQLRGNRDERMVVRLYDTQQNASRVKQELQQAGFDVASIETVAVPATDEVYRGEGSTLDETIMSGAVGGAIWVGILGAISGAMTVWTPGLGPIGSLPAPTTWALITIGGVLVGALFGAILGLLIGMGIQEEDDYVFSRGVQEESQIVKLHANRSQEGEARKIMRRIELMYRNGRGEVVSA